MNSSDWLPSSGLLVFGAGGHGRVVADAAQLGGARALASDRDAALCQGELLPGVPLFAPQALPASFAAVHVAIGNNVWREREAGLWTHQPLASVIHPAAVVARSALVGEGAFVAAMAVVSAGVEMSKGVIINHGAVVDHDCALGEFCHVAPHATLGGAVILGRRVLVGAGAVVLPGLKISDDVVVGAGAVVHQDLTEAGTYVGVPARKIS